MRRVVITWMWVLLVIFSPVLVLGMVYYTITNLFTLGMELSETYWAGRQTKVRKEHGRTLH